MDSARQDCPSGKRNLLHSPSPTPDSKRRRSSIAPLTTQNLEHLAPQRVVKRCLITGAELGDTAERTAIVPLDVGPGLVYRLERSWKTRPVQLNSSNNMEYFSEEWGESFKKFHWFLVPDRAALNELSKQASGAGWKVRYQPTSQGGDSSPSFTKGTLPSWTPIDELYQAPFEFQYRLCAFSNMKDVVLRRFDSQGGYVDHQYPFSTLGVLKSHVRPHFFAYDAGRKLLERVLYLLSLNDDRHDRDHLDLFCVLFERSSLDPLSLFDLLRLYAQYALRYITLPIYRVIPDEHSALVKLNPNQDDDDDGRGSDQPEARAKVYKAFLEEEANYGPRHGHVSRNASEDDLINPSKISPPISSCSHGDNWRPKPFRLDQSRICRWVQDILKAAAEGGWEPTDGDPGDGELG